MGYNHKEKGEGRKAGFGRNAAADHTYFSRLCTLYSAAEIEAAEQKKASLYHDWHSEAGSLRFAFTGTSNL